MTENELRKKICPLLTMGQGGISSMSVRCVGRECALFRETYMRTPSDVWCGLAGRADS